MLGVLYVAVLWRLRGESMNLTELLLLIIVFENLLGFGIVINMFEHKKNER